MEPDSIVVVRKDLFDGLGGLDGDSGLLDDDLVHGVLPVGEVRSLVGAEASSLGGCVHEHEDDVRVGRHDAQCQR